ncbi:MAG: cbb3-type cytochrome c oxidase subunit [Verrucomicrobiaceae bacterium]|nr:cbb3-type cytochrome c oxidase subunit [Verrucomicrobiaceae bacterium]
MKYFFLSYIFVVILVVGAAGFRGDKFQQTPLYIFPDMKEQPKVKYQAASAFFSDGLGERLPITHTVPMGFDIPAKASANGATPPKYGFSNGLDFYNTGRVGDFYGDGFPEELGLDAGLLERGQQRFNIYCAVCHGQSGNGKGITSKYGILTAFNFQQAGSTDPKNPAGYRPTGAIFDTITNGKGLMGPYGGVLPVRDRWAIISYIRTLQLAGKEVGVQ